MTETRRELPFSEIPVKFTLWLNYQAAHELESETKTQLGQLRDSILKTSDLAALEKVARSVAGFEVEIRSKPGLIIIKHQDKLVMQIHVIIG
jgi:hypothetical protein